MVAQGRKFRHRVPGVAQDWQSIGDGAVSKGASMASDPEGIVDTLRELARLDPVELGLQAVLDQIVQAATSCCGITGGVGLLLLGPHDQLHYVAVAGRRRSLLGGTKLPDDEGPSVEAFVHDQPVSSSDLGAERRWPAFRQQAIAAGIRAWLSVPVRQRHGPIGALDFARTGPQPWQPQDLATSSAFTRLIMATLELATARQQEGLTPELQFAVQHDARVEQARGVLMERERVDEAAASTLLQQQAQIEGRPLRAIAERILAHVRR
jgi:GAF domain-containing protein